VAKQYELGQLIGIDGTPAIVLANGELIPGYRPAPELAKLALEAK
jgi:thiol:disulfide interchange protein DsbC